MIDWNLTLKLGLIGFCAAIFIAIWFVVRLVLKQPVRRLWVVGFVLLSFVSMFTMLGSQVTIISKLSIGGGEDDNAEISRVK